ncbi:GNAT family N-acetyltransferase [Botrimarina mediterranea]|uniref:GNAT family N-acetyltransferase n=1 Tax=Botrimarina mediterranea TaxID=2528022 RepID=UPI00118B7F4D|nr:FemAB family protein [Planctomycetes bacterium K2D]
MDALRVLRADRVDERAAWIDLWSQSPAQEVFTHPAYLEIFRQRSDHDCCCATMSSDAGTVLYPFYLRHLQSEYGLGLQCSEAKDITTPYGYGGPYAWGQANPKELAKAFWGAFDNWTMQENVVSEFIRFSLFEDELLPYPGEVESPLMNVVRSLDLTEEELWGEVRHKVRKNVKRGRSAGIEVIIDGNGNRLGDFLSIYHRTMDRRCADASFYYDANFFESFCDALAGRYCFVHAMSGDLVVASELVLVSPRNVYSFLGGTDPAHFSNRPNDLLKFEVMLWAKSEGKRNFVLGGGKAAADGIYKYKESFAPNGVRPFRVGKRILNSVDYGRLAAARSKSVDLAYFPAYRAA